MIFSRIIAGAVAVIVLPSMFFYRIEIKDTVEEWLKPPLPVAQNIEEIEIAPATNTVPEDNALASMPLEMNLDVPFTPQAPHANWSLPYKEACEEASVLMVHRFYTGEALDPEIANKELLEMVKWEEDVFGYYIDTTAEETAKILREYFGHDRVDVIYDFSIEDIKRHVAAGRPVLLPAIGRLLPNPYFKTPGPLYHMLVVKGFTKDGQIITNEPGTRRGHDFLYDPDALMNAVHDWNPEDVYKGVKAMVVTYPNTSEVP